jgi:uncharacterized protein YndB with AHSA1/START domain
MKKLYVCQSIEIKASPSKVWAVLTRPEFTDQWATAFANGLVSHIESDWKAGSRVVWKDGEGNILVEGNVTALEPGYLLRYTAFDVHSPEKPTFTAQDGITYKLMQTNGKLTFHLMQGDFASLNEGEKYKEASAEVWSQVLPKIKALAEGSAEWL